MQSVVVATLLSFLILTACSQNKSTQDAEDPISKETDSLGYIDFVQHEDQFRCYPVDGDVFDHPVDTLPMPVAPHESIWPRIQSGLN